MAKFTKYNNPNRRRKVKKSPYSQGHINERKAELEILLAKAKTETERDLLLKAFDVSINP